MAAKLHPSPYHDRPCHPPDPKSIELFWRGWFGTGPARYYPQANSEDEKILRQFVCQIYAGHSPHIEMTECDRLLEIAGEYGYSVTFCGEPSDDAKLRQHRKAYARQYKEPPQ